MNEVEASEHSNPIEQTITSLETEIKEHNAENNTPTESVEERAS